jgi:hypothetical protein
MKKFLCFLVLVFFVAVLSFGQLLPDPKDKDYANAPGQDQPQRAKFYALGVVCVKNVQNAKDSLGAPDGRYAEILPGGQLIVLMENKLYPFLIGNPEGGGAMADSGSVVGKGGADIGLEGWSPWQDTQGKQHYDWMILEVSVTGFILPPISSFEGSPGVDMIRITNPGTKSLFLDAVVGYGVVKNIPKPLTANIL